MAVVLTTLVSFNGSDGGNPFGSLIADANGDLFGTTIVGGANGSGTVFEIVKTALGYASSPVTLVNFNLSTGAEPQESLIADANGDLFGTTSTGGANGGGTVFEIVKTASGYANSPTILVNFNGSNDAPLGSLIADANGDLFGTTWAGGANGGGTVFEIVKTASGYASSPVTLVSFNGSNGDALYGSLIADAKGDLLGTTAFGGANGVGTVFEIVKTASGYASSPVTLVSFNGSNGAEPIGSLIADANGDLFGTTTLGGTNNDGTVFEIVKTTSGYANSPTILVNFNGGSGAQPNGNLIADANGDLFGTTIVGGTNNDGTVFEIVKTTSGYANSPTILVNFNGSNGAFPSGSLIPDADGNLLATTQQQIGGANGDNGTVFEISNSGFVPFPTIQPPVIDTAHSILSVVVDKVPNAPASTTPDTAQGTITFTDSDLATTTATVPTATVVFRDAQGLVESIAGNSTDLLLAFQVGPVTSSSNVGSVGWTYSIPNSELSWLGGNGTATVTASVQINDGQGDTTTQAVTVTIHGANDPPVIDLANSVVSGTTSHATIGGTVEDVTQGTLAFSDPNVDDLPTGSVTGQSVVAHDSAGNVITLTQAQIAGLESAFSIMPAPGNTNAGTIDWAYALLDQSASFLSAGESATITSTVQVNDHNGGTVTQGVAVTIGGSSNPNQQMVSEAASDLQAVLSSLPGVDLVSSTLSALYTLMNAGVDLPGLYADLTSHGVDQAFVNSLEKAITDAGATLTSGAQSILSIMIDVGVDYLVDHGVLTNSEKPLADSTAQSILSGLLTQPLSMLAPVQLTSGSLIDEMAQLAADAYSGQSGVQMAEQHFWTPVALNINSGVTSPELGVTLNFSFANGVYSAQTITNPNLVGPVFADNGGAGALVLEGLVNGKPTLVISFEGSTSLDNIIDGSNPASQWAKYAPLMAAVESFATNPANGITQVLLTGHSLGGAMVQYAMNQTFGSGTLEGFTWGSPGGQIDPANTNIINFEHAGDFVPVGGGLVGDHLVGTEVLVNNSLNNSTFQNLISLSLSQHDMSNYQTDTQYLVQDAFNLVSPFYQTTIASALRSGDSSGGQSTVHVAVGTGSNQQLSISADDQYVFTNGSNAAVIWPTNSFGSLPAIPPSPIFVVGGPGNVLQLPGFQNEWSWQTQNSLPALTNLYFEGQLVSQLVGISDIKVAGVDHFVA